MDIRKYILVNCNSNNNRYCNITIEKNRNRFCYEIGRVGARGLKRYHSLDQLPSFEDDLLKKGYKNISETVSQPQREEGIEEIPDNEIRNLVERLISYSKKALKEAEVDFTSVSDEAVDKVQDLIYDLEGAKDVDSFNKIILQIVEIIPRKMKDVKEVFVSDKRDFRRKVIEEQSLLDNIRTARGSANVKKEGGTILDRFGLEIYKSDDETTKQVVSHLHPEIKGLVKAVYTVHNKSTYENMCSYMKKRKMDKADVHFLYHGSLNRNQWGLITQGPHCNPPKGVTITGKMFGYGVYFANNAKKSVNYTSLMGSYWTHGEERTAFLQVYKLAYNKPLDLYRWDPSCAKFQKGKIGDHDAVFAHKQKGFLVNDEIIAYDDSAFTIAYLIELTK
jgi:poly [ADP-ribose] polymerase